MYLGLDFGTSGVRACVIDDDANIKHQDRFAYQAPACQTPEDWRVALNTLLKQLPSALAAQLKRIAIDATSSTVLLVDIHLQPVSPALLYNDTRSLALTQELIELAPAGHTVCNASSGLSKFLWLTRNNNLDNVAHFMHQADWLNALLTGIGGISDYHNALKSGYDAEHMCWPHWVMKLPHSDLLPHVIAPGSLISEINQSLAQHFGINPSCAIHAGTTDSIAAFIAADVHQAGDAVTSLGSTMVLKLLSTKRVEAAKYGVYSHRYGDFWLAGGASNSGGEVLGQFFSEVQLAELSQKIDGTTDSPLDYYPLPRKGERFPHNDPEFQSRLEPRPADNTAFLHGLLHGLSRIEAEGYALLVKLGASPLTSVSTTGGGAGNAGWMQIRRRLLGVPVCAARNTEAAYGSAILARRTVII